MGKKKGVGAVAFKGTDLTVAGNLKKPPRLRNN